MAIRVVVSAQPFVDPDAGLAVMAGEMGWVAAAALLPLVLVSQLFSSPLLEEAGWRGYALPRLQGRVGALLAGVTLGAVWESGICLSSSPTETRSFPTWPASSPIPS